MKTQSKTEAKKLAKAYSYNKDYRDVPVYIIYCSRTENYYVDTNSLIRTWERFIGYYINGVFTTEKAEHCPESAIAKLKNQQSWEDI